MPYGATWDGAVGGNVPRTRVSADSVETASGGDDVPRTCVSADGAEVIDLIVGLTREFRTATPLVTHDLVHLPQLDAVLHLVDGAVREPLAG